jgi:hypothetical protein
VKGRIRDPAKGGLKWFHITHFFNPKCGDLFKRAGTSLTPINEQQGVADM